MSWFHGPPSAGPSQLDTSIGARLLDSQELEAFMSRRAFTLIELLVVIAIIAILAAILFPVFAQAKAAAKKTQALSNAKQMGTALVLYSADYEDYLPTGNVPNLTTATVRYYTGWQALNPAGWYADDPSANLKAEDELVWHNTIYPYMKNTDLILTSGSRTVNISGWEARYASPLLAPKGGNLTFNGLLQHWSSTNVEAPSKLPMLWQGQGDLHRKGLAMANPRLACTNSAGGPCLFNPMAMPQGNAGTQGASWTLYGSTSYAPWSGANIYVSVDSSARVVKYGPGNNAAFPANCSSLVPFTPVNSDGSIFNSAGSTTIIGARSTGSSVGYPCAFRPDNDFE